MFTPTENQIAGIRQVLMRTGLPAYRIARAAGLSDKTITGFLYHPDRDDKIALGTIIKLEKAIQANAFESEQP